MTRVFSVITYLLILLRIHVAYSLSQIRSAEPVEDETGKHSQSVLILGSSVDRYAISLNYPGQTFTKKNERLRHEIVHDEPRNVTVAVLQHPGVGLFGDLNKPFWNPGLAYNVSAARNKRLSPSRWIYGSEATWKVIKRAPQFCHDVFGVSQPDLVVVETSLWDLAGWWQNTGGLQATPERLQKWCDHDLPHLLEFVTYFFNQSRVIFRTAPQVAPWSTERWTQADFEAMHECVVRRSAGTGEVIEHVGVLDYHEIVDKLIASASAAKSLAQVLWQDDGYHPAALPGRLYLNEVFKLLGVRPLEDRRRESLREGRILVEDEDDL